jgi:hypothetical protein
LKVRYDVPLSNIAFNFNLRRYTTDAAAAATDLPVSTNSGGGDAAAELTALRARVSELEAYVEGGAVGAPPAPTGGFWNTAHNIAQGLDKMLF